MSMRKFEIRNWRRQLSLELRRDKKRAVALVVLFVFAALLGTRLVLKYTKPTPARAAAKAVVAPIREEGARPPAGARMGGSHADWLAQLRTEQAEITRDMFAPNPAYFPPEVETKTHVEISEPGQTEADPNEPHSSTT